jgi:hypothetical protein
VQSTKRITLAFCTCRHIGVEPEPELESQLPRLPSLSPSPSPPPSQILTQTQTLHRPAEPTQTQSQALPFQSDPFDSSDYESLDAVEYGIHITVKYDGKMLFSNTRWFEQLDHHVYDKVLKIETDEVDKASTAKGRTKHRDVTRKHKGSSMGS